LSDVLLPLCEIQAAYTFTKNINGSGWNSQGLTFLLGLLSVVSVEGVEENNDCKRANLSFVFRLQQWTMTDYDATAHISEEVKRAQIAAPTAIFVAVIGTGIVGW